MDDTFTSLIKDEADKISITNDIKERQQIVSFYSQFGFLTLQQRNTAIQKIIELRMTDGKVAAIYAASPKGTPLDSCPDSELINQLQMQILTLTAELADKELNSHG